MKLAFVTAIVFAVFSTTNGAKILALMHDMAASHSLQSRPLFLELAARGHQVTVLSGYPEKEAIPNYKDIVIDSRNGVAKDIDYQKLVSSTPLESLEKMSSGDWEVFENIVRLGINSNGTQSLIRSKESFDLIFVDLTLGAFYLGFVHKFGNPHLIGIAPYGMSTLGDIFVGNPETPSCIPTIHAALSSEMNFFERVMNWVFYIKTQSVEYDFLIPLADRRVRENFGPGYPSVLDIGRNMSLLMMNHDVTTDYPRPLVPATIPIGGLRLKPAAPLPKEFERYLEESKNGVIYFSLSNVQSNKIRPEKLAAILATFRDLPYNVLWKYDDVTMSNRPSNVKIVKWVPQSDILAHRNVKLVVFDGGIYTLEEAVFHKVPVVVMPIAGDQPFHAKRVETLGIGVQIDYNTLDKRSLLTAIHQVLDNPAYRENVTRVSRRFLDDPQTALQRAVFWTEYVLKHDGAHHLRFSGALLPAYQYFLVDVVAAALTFLVITVVAAVFALKTIYGVLWRSRKMTLPVHCVSRRQGKVVLVGVLGAVGYAKAVVCRIRKSLEHV